MKAIEQKLNIHGSAELKIEKAFSQVVNGVYYWFHLFNLQNGEQYSACVYQPLGGGVENLEVAIAEKGWT